MSEIKSDTVTAATLRSVRVLVETDLKAWEQQRLSAAATLMAEDAAVQVSQSLVDDLVEGSRRTWVARAVLDILNSSDSDEEKLRRLRKTARENSILTYVPSSTWLLHHAAAWGRIYSRMDFGA